jgi:OOP family OmpA-OmpF porin
MPPPPPLVKDTDGDGIPDSADNCPKEAGPKENNGCPDTDRDKDGVIDRKDKCPDEPGPPERDGCPEPDRDHDGIVDSKDKCPDEAEDKDGFEDEDGCPDPDNDHDGIPDVKDKCPNEPETKNGYQDDDGCPDEVPVAVKKFTGVIKGITFRRNSADVKASSFPLLKEAVKVFRDYPDLRVEISGHTSNDGRREFNVKLSKKRAESVKGFLTAAGIDETRVSTVGYGPDKPIEDNGTKTGQEKNRRIEFRLLGADEKINLAEPPGPSSAAPGTDLEPEPPARAKDKEKAATKKSSKAKIDVPPEGDPTPSKK